MKIDQIVGNNKMNGQRINNIPQYKISYKALMTLYSSLYNRVLINPSIIMYLNKS